MNSLATSMQNSSWTPTSWQQRVALQQPHYEDAAELAQAIEQLGHLPPLVTSWEVLSLKQSLAEAQEGKRFLLQGGDCAESFADCTSPIISNRLKVLLQMSLVLVHGLKQPVLRVGRFAGQYAKPRSADTETRGDATLPSYRGDFVNQPEFTPEARTPDPRRMVKGHARSAMTMNFVRALIDGGFADLHHPEYWDLKFLHHAPLRDAYLAGDDATVAREIEAVKEACGSAHLKVILETAELPTYAHVRHASQLAIDAGADVIKTSTGKAATGATPGVVLVMLETVREHLWRTGKVVGVKAAGGVSNTKTALHMLVLVKETLGDDWLTPDRFRIGASSLLNDLLMQYAKLDGGHYGRAEDFSKE